MVKPRPFLALLGALVLATSLIGQAQAARPVGRSAAPAFVAPPIKWGPCTDAFLQSADAQCGLLTVPLDHADPAGPTIQVAVSRVRHTAPAARYRGVIFTNPGGPGGSGLWMAALGQFVPNKVGSRYDWIGMDPRGVGESVPALSCDGRYFSYNRPPYVPTRTAIKKAWLARTDGYATACANSSAAALLPHLKTTDTIADMEVLRTALGAEQITFYGASYGTYIAQVYATLHPDRLAGMVLDGVVDPTKVWYDSNLAQDPAFERVINRFFAWVGRHQSLYHLGSSGAAVRARYYRLLAKVTRHPANGRVGAAELSDALIPAGYTVQTWHTVAEALAKFANQGKAKPIARLYRDGNPVGPGADNGYAMYLATQCTDAAWPRPWSVWQADNDRVYAKAPFLTWGNAWYNAPCRSWPAPAGTPVTVSGAQVDFPVLLISETLDAATPFAGALQARRTFPTAALVAGMGGTTHAASLNGVECVDNAIAAYLADGTLPKRRSGNGPDLKCPALHVPRDAGVIGSPLHTARLAALTSLG